MRPDEHPWLFLAFFVGFWLVEWWACLQLAAKCLARIGRWSGLFSEPCHQSQWVAHPSIIPLSRLTGETPICAGPDVDPDKED